MKIVIVDDNPSALRLLTAQVQGLEIADLVPCRSGAEAVLAFERDPGGIDLVICDLQMPEIDGVEVLRHLARLGYGGRIVLLSAEDERVLHTAKTLAQAHGLNVVAALQKPVQLEKLAELLLAPVAGTGCQDRAYGPDELGPAILGGHLSNVYQPRVDVASGLVVGVEALVRWHHPTDGLLLPHQFVPAAEEHGLIDALTRLVLGQALEQSRRWRDVGLELAMSVNISMDNLADLGFPNQVSNELGRHRIPPKSLILEVTERRLVKDPQALLEILSRLRLKRIGLSIDDFGTGHSSLTQLRDLPFDELKIDRSFVHGAGHNTTLRAFFEGSCKIARDLQMNAVAEGVEDHADWTFVRASSCAQAQGHFISPPMRGECIPTWVAGWSPCQPLTHRA